MRTEKQIKEEITRLEGVLAGLTRDEGKYTYYDVVYSLIDTLYWVLGESPLEHLGDRYDD
jgi:hypothetical protein